MKMRCIFLIYYFDCIYEANNFSSFLKLNFFKNVIAEILKNYSFSSVTKTKFLKANCFRSED